jgi:hypothetical protein
MASGGMGAFDDTFLLATSLLPPRSLRACWCRCHDCILFLYEMSARAPRAYGTWWIAGTKTGCISAASPEFRSEVVGCYFFGWLAMIWSLILLYVA